MFDLTFGIGDLVSGMAQAGAIAANTTFQKDVFNYQKKLQQQIFAR